MVIELCQDYVVALQLGKIDPLVRSRLENVTGIVDISEVVYGVRLTLKAVSGIAIHTWYDAYIYIVGRCLGEEASQPNRAFGDAGCSVG